MKRFLWISISELLVKGIVVGVGVVAGETWHPSIRRPFVPSTTRNALFANSISFQLVSL